MATFDDYGYPLTFFGALLENIVFGLFLPGGTIILLAAAYSRAGTLQWPIVLLLGWSGMILGNSIDYWLGQSALRPLIMALPMKEITSRGLERGRELLDRYGAGAVFAGHFLSHTRSFVALAAGASHFPFRRYLMFELSAAFAWNLLYTSLGYVVGANLDKVQMIFERIGLVGLSAIAVAGFIALLLGRRGLLAPTKGPARRP